MLKLTVCAIMPLDSLLSQYGKYLIGKCALSESNRYSIVTFLGKNLKKDLYLYHIELAV